MARPYHLTLLSVFSFLLLTGLVTADLSGENKVGKIVTMTVQYPAAGSPPGEKTTISAHYVDENGGGDRRFNLDCDDDEPYVSLSLCVCVCVSSLSLSLRVIFLGSVNF
uniref:Uncharacterized protein n=1 Tax=Triticum urartu TaxID=4572 RepID=A0A8R7QNP0_TRIUA